MAKILLIEDTEIIRHSTSAALKHEGFDVISAPNGVEGLELALAENPDMILCDVMMPGMDGYQVLNQLQKKQITRTIPFVFLTGKDTREDVRHGMHLGADDYLTKPFTRVELLQTIQSQLKKRDAIKSHYEEYIQKLETPEENSNQYDAVTALPNILYLKEKFTFFINHLDNAQIRNPGQNFHLPFWVLKIERHDKIKQILGYEGYNELLKNIAQRFQQTKLKERQEFALISDSEFALLWMPVEEKKESAERAKEIINLFNNSYNIQEKEIFIDIRIGICFYPRSGHNLEELIKTANLTLDNTANFAAQKYEFCVAENNLQNEKRALIETELHYAQERKQLEVYYQPQINLASGKVTGLEALLRWHHPLLGSIPPSDFIPIAEETGLIESIGYWSLQAAVSQTYYWQEKYQQSLRLAINISAYQLNSSTICHDILRVLAEENFNPKYLDLEITESILIDDFQKVSEKLKMLQRVGINIAIDDFGTGYSSFNYTRLFPWDILKIDRCFVNDLHKSKINAAITKGLIEMSHALGFKVIAEGVENSAELAVLNEYGCDEVQGYFLGRPVSAKLLEQNIFQTFENVTH